MEQPREQSEFNSAISYLNRINSLFYQADEASMSLDAFQWFHSLLALYRELSTELKDDEIEEFEKIRRELAESLNQILYQQRRGRNIGLNSELYDGLHLFEMRLRRIMKESGLQIKMREDASQALR